MGGFFSRSAKGSQVYHDTGTMTVERSKVDDCTVIARLTGFQFPIRGLVDLQSAYLVEFARLMGIKITVRLRRSTAEGDPYCEWEYRVERSPAAVASLARLPLDSR